MLRPTHGRFSIPNPALCESGSETSYATPFPYCIPKTHALRPFHCQRLDLGYGEREARGLELLKEWLSPEQFAQYDAKGYFEVTGCHSGKRYRISHGAAMNIHEIDGAGCPRGGWCFVPKGHLVAGDVMLAQKIALETDERGALAVANKFFEPTGRRNMLLHY
jgi:hypothetical protein